MPGGGITANWNEASPAETDIADAAPIRSIETSLRNILAVEHNFPSASGPNFGYHLLGSCRAYVDVQSNVSSTGTDGRLMQTSDTSRFFHVGSGGTSLIGGATVPLIGSYPGTVPQRSYWAIEFGSTFAPAGTASVTWPNSGFSGVPTVTASASTDNGTQQAIVVTMQNPSGSVSATGAFFRAVHGSTDIAVSNVTIHWISIGSRTL